MALDNKTTALLKHLKEKVNLEDFLITEGFYVDIDSCWGERIPGDPNRKEHMVYKNGTYILGVSFDKGKWIAFDMKGNLTGPKSSGDIVQIYRELYGKSFREALSDLSRRYGHIEATQKPTPKIKTKTDNVADETKPRRWKKIEEDLAGLKLVTEFWHLEVERGITRATLNSKRFFGKILHGNCNVMFPHVFKTLGKWVYCGYEIKRKNYSRFSAEGVRGLWMSHMLPDDHSIVFCESAIDCLSWHIINDSPEGVGYVSVAGRISKVQFALIKKILLAAKDRKPPTKIILAFDSDTAGRGFTRQVQDLIPELNMTVDPPPSGYKDWNEYLTDTEG